ncbi:MAG: hypothetical protein HYU66_12810 [Armatimonadetes bacterium]|nr:hypothetical protein [Armatimonadota bacterium]
MGSVHSCLRRLAAATVAVALVAAAIGGCSSSTNPAPTTGSARVTIQPAGAAAATWTLDGGAARASGATVSGLSPGNHTVHFNALAGFTAPADQQVTVAAGQTTNAVGTYTAIVPTTGSVQVTIQPAGAAAATWTVDGGAAQADGATVTNLAPGAHTIHFNALAGFNAPADQQATVTAGQTTNVIGAYTGAGARSDVDMLGSDQFGPRACYALRAPRRVERCGFLSMYRWTENSTRAT